MDRISLSVERGEIFGFLGPNGGGKTTLFRILSTAMRLSTGDAQLFGLSLSHEPGKLREKMGVVFQNPSLDEKLTVFENMLHQGHLYGLRGGVLRQRIGDLLKRFSLEDRRNEVVEHLSGGLKRRIEVAKGILHKPALLLMDEPCTGLDPGARRDLWAILAALKSDGVTILLTTHLMDEAERCDRVAILNQGRIVALGTPVQLKARIGGDVVRIQTTEPQRLAQAIKEKFKLEPLLIDGSLRIEIPEGHRFIPQVVEMGPGLVSSITLGKPTLEDVFVHETGHKFWTEPKTEP